MEPLLHLVRNAISHGIEPASDRVSAGKAAVASIHLRASAASETIIIEVEDDGRGIDERDVARRARAAGLIGNESELDEATLLETICLPHFTTRDQADRASGRGVGMDIVKTAVEQLGGSLSLNTQVGRGTRFRIQLPLTLAIADALIVRVGGQRFAVPQSAVSEVIQLEAKDVTTLENNEVISHRGNVVPLVRLTKLFQRTPEANARACADYRRGIQGRGHRRGSRSWLARSRRTTIDRLASASTGHIRRHGIGRWASRAHSRRAGVGTFRPRKVRT